MRGCSRLSHDHLGMEFNETVMELCHFILHEPLYIIHVSSVNLTKTRVFEEQELRRCFSTAADEMLAFVGSCRYPWQCHGSGENILAHTEITVQEGVSFPFTAVLSHLNRHVNQLLPAIGKVIITLISSPWAFEEMNNNTLKDWKFTIMPACDFICCH